jgi:hypothetical protein
MLSQKQIDGLSRSVRSFVREYVNAIPDVSREKILSICTVFVDSSSSVTTRLLLPDAEERAEICRAAALAEYDVIHGIQPD